jgi:Sulfatase
MSASGEGTRGALLPLQATRFDKVLVFVMETMTSAVMDQQKAVLPSSTFVHSARATSHVFNRYFASNQDSRTGMLSMLGSRFIPFEAYTEEGRDHYMKLGERSSLVDQFDKLGYRTAFAVSQQEIELVVGDLPWHSKIHLEEGDVSRLQGEYLCFVPYEFEHSCEDRALLPRVLDFIDQNERVFLYQEFIWGHASEYNKASGRTNTEYYSTYLDAVVRHLQKTGQLERTLIVLTSDHGFRDKGLQNDLAVYQIPLLFHAAGFTGQEDARLFSHLDFKDLLMHELLPAAPAPEESSFVLVIGPTGTSFLTVLTQPGQMLLMKAREGERYLVHAAGYRDAPDSHRNAGDFLRLFDDYLTYFSKL